MDLKRVLSLPPYPGDYLHPVVYACTAVMLLCLLVSIITYQLHHSVIRISRNGRHTLLNFLFHTGLTFGVFAGGINQVHAPGVCQAVGGLLHYASLSTMLWLTVSARNLCGDVSRDPLQTPGRRGPAQTRPERSVLRLYLVSDGVPLVIVGVTAVFSLDNYGSRDGALYCWMAWGPSLGGFYAPMSLLVLAMSLYFLCTYVQLRRHPERRYELRVLSEEQRQLSSTDSSHLCHPEGGASGPAGDRSPFSAAVSVLANEHSFKSQLRATAFTLFLFLATWALGALAVSLGHFLDMIFSCLYGAFCVTLGLFLLIQHCAKREDVWNRWWVCCRSGSKADEGSNQKRGPELHLPHCHLSSPCSGKRPLVSPHLRQGSYDQVTPPPQSPVPGAAGPCCVAVMSPASPAPPLADPAPSPRPQSLPDELPRPALPLHSCLADRAKSRSFNRPRPRLQDYRAHVASLSVDGSVHSSHLDSPHAAPQLEGSPLVSNSPDLQLDRQLASRLSLQRQTSCHSVQDSLTSCHNHAHSMHDSITSCHSLLLPSHGVQSCQWHAYTSADPSSRPDPLTVPYQQDPSTYGEQDAHWSDAERRGFPRNTLPRQHAPVGRRAPIGRNRSLQEDGLLGSDATGNIRTGPWKNETTV